MGSSGSGCAPVTGFCEGGNELQENSGLVEQLLVCEEDSALWSYLQFSSTHVNKQSCS